MIYIRMIKKRILMFQILQSVKANREGKMMINPQSLVQVEYPNLDRVKALLSKSSGMMSNNLE